MAQVTPLAQLKHWWDVNKMGALAWYALCLLGGIALDWAFVERFSTILEIFIKRGVTLAYRDGLFPRIIVTVIAAIGFAYGSVHGSPPNVFFLCWGCLVFIVYDLGRIHRVQEKLDSNVDYAQFPC